MIKINIGDRIDDFSLRDQHGKLFNSRDNRGKKIVIFFYPKDQGLFCMKEACAFRDSFSEFTNAGVVVVGINFRDSMSHADFATENHLPYALLSDTGNMVLKSFGIKHSFIFSGRETFLIDEMGIVLYKYRAFFDTAGHATKMLEFLNTTSS
jgi:peroxiredoxin Q/BCP